MQSAAVAVGIMTGLGLLFAALLALAYRFLKVEEDPRIEAVEDRLPASNCGACGEPGCRAFAEKLVAGELEPSACTVSSGEAIAGIAGLLGVEAGEREKRIAKLHCAGGRLQAEQIAAYAGHGTCSAAAVVAGGGKGCSWGCLGLGDCVDACTFDAMFMNDQDLPVVLPDPCTACGDCVDACPRDLLEVLPLKMPLLVQCNIPLAGDLPRALCRVACDACGLCAADAPGVVTMVGGLPVIDPTAHDRAHRSATLRCPTGAIKWVEGQQFPESQRERRRHAGA